MVDSEEGMRQYAPFPQVLADLVAKLKYRQGWSFELKDIERDHPDTHGGGAGGLTFVGLTGTNTWNDDDTVSYAGAMDAYHPEQPRPVYFYFPVPAATYDESSWRRWLFERILDVERHEAMEHFGFMEEVIEVDAEDDSLLGRKVERVVRPYSPIHAPGHDPYIVHEMTSDELRRTSFRGVVKEDK